MRFGHGLWLGSSQAVAASGAIAAPFASVNGPTGDFFSGSKFEGWSANYASQPTVNTPVAFTVSRQTWTATDSATLDTSAAGTTLETMYVTTTVRKPWPISVTGTFVQSDLTAALSDYIYSTDTVSGGATNNSTITSPKPIARWALQSRRVVGNTCRVEVVAFHRNARAGKQVAGVVFTATDGSHTVTATVATPAVSAYAYDIAGNKVIVYGVDLDVSTFTDNTAFTVDAVVYPLIGGAGTTSLRRSVDGTAGNDWEFATRTFYKHTAKVANPPLVYVIAAGTDDVVGTDGKGTVAQVGLQKVSTTAATAKANGFATLKSAVEALKAATTLTGGFTDGCEVRISNTTVASGTSITAGTYQTAGEMVITRDPTVAKASCILSFGLTATALRQSWVRIFDLTLDRAGGTSQPSLTAPGQLTIENCTFDNSARASQFVASATVNQAWLGTSFTNGTATLLGASTTPQGLIRACSGTGLTVETSCVLGCTLTTALGAVVSATAGRSSNSVLAFNKLLTITGSSAFPFAGTDCDGLAHCQNLFEYTVAGTPQPSYRPSGDDVSNNLTHLVLHNNTFAGSGSSGRINTLYDETDNVRRVHKLISVKGNILGAGLYTKGDIFHGANDANPEGYTSVSLATSSQALGQWPYYYGVGCGGNFSQYGVPTAPETQVYAGRGSLMGSSTTASQITLYSDLFTANAAVTYNNGGISTAGNYTVGAGGGTYTLTNSGNNTAKSILESALFSHTLDGVARSTTNDHPGAFSAA